nr:hypothetical protein [Tanacetum cinerariifolium]
MIIDRPIRLEGLATWDGGKTTWGGRVEAMGTVPMCVYAQESWDEGTGVLAGKIGKGTVWFVIVLGFRQIRSLGIIKPPPAQYLGYKSLAASHVAASYWTAASDVAATSAPVNDVGQLRSTPPATGQRRRITVVIGGQRWRSTTVAGGEPRLTAAGPPLTTTGPPVNGGLVKVGHGPGLDRVWAGSATWHATCQPRVHTWHPRGC